MNLCMLSLKYLASRAVLLHHLDTTELPLRIQKELQQYKELRGAFKILSIDWEVERLDRGEVTDGERLLAGVWVLENCAGLALTKTPHVFEKLGQNKWSIARADRDLQTAAAAAAQTDATIRLPEPDQLVHGVRLDKTEQYNTYTGHCLRNGKLYTMEKKERNKLYNEEVELEVVEIKESCFELDWSNWYWLTCVQRCEKPLRGLVVTITTRAIRAEGSGHFPVF